ncbi:MAG: serine hydrolase [Acidimicrobiales bacterium]
MKSRPEVQGGPRGDVARSATVIDLLTGRTLLTQAGSAERSTASVPKLLVLVELAARIEHDPAEATRLLDRRGVEPVGDSGLWQHLGVDELAVDDVARLVGAVSDNLATNVLINHIGLQAIASRGSKLNMTVTELHDIVRDHRAAPAPKRLSTGSSDDLARLMAWLYNDRSAVGPRVLEWMSHSVDLSMVAGAFGLDPLSHGCLADRGFEIWSKTGTDDGVRADVGIVKHGNAALAYAAIANWSPSGLDHERDDVLASMDRFGTQLRSIVEGRALTDPLAFG